jgi:hypothetical protein
MNDLAASLVRIAASQVGVRESGGNNRGPSIVEYQKASWLPPGPWPWCAAFCCWALREMLHTPAGAMFLDGARVDEWRCKDAKAFGWERWARDRRLTVLSESAVPHAGDLVIYDFSHIGVVENADDWPRVIHTIEGNTNGRGDRDSTTGDGVWRKARPPTKDLIKCYVRLERLP